MATKIDIYAEEIFPVYFISVFGILRDVSVIVEESELADMLAVQENYSKLQAKLRDLYVQAKDAD